MCLIAGLVNRGLATLKAEKVRAGGKLIAVAKARITEAGREAIRGKVDVSPTWAHAVRLRLPLKNKHVLCLFLPFRSTVYCRRLLVRADRAAPPGI